MKSIHDELHDTVPNPFYGFGTTYRMTSINAQATKRANHAVIGLVEKPHIYHGYMMGFHQPVGAIILRVQPLKVQQMNGLMQAANYYFSAPHDHVLTESNSLASFFGEGVCALQKMAGFPIFDAIQIEPHEEKNNLVCLWIPTQVSPGLHQTINCMLNLINHHGSSPEFVPNPAIEQYLKTLIPALRREAPRGRNSLKLLRSAHDLGIPWKHLTQNTYQYGHGRHSRWFDSSFTDKTPQVSAALAKDKHSTSRLLSKAGLPVPEQYTVRNEVEALSIAKKIGYPVVIKPHNQDGGRGVFAHLVSEKGVQKAYQQARQFSDTILLEKHVHGKDYRLVVLNGQLIWAVERTPAGVTGDGVNTISTLIQHVNQQPERGTETHSPLKRIQVTEDVVDFLTEQGLDLHSVPEQGKFIPLNRIANVSTGGTPTGVLDKVHPDNKRLVETAVNLLRLDLAGVDFISPNIEQSYLEIGGTLIEINAQPQMGLTPQHVYAHLMSTLVPHQGRIPIFVIASNLPQNAFIQSAKHRLSSEHKTIGVAQEQGAYINEQLIVPTDTVFVAGELLLAHHTVDALIYCIRSWKDIELNGLPFDTYDALFFSQSFMAMNDCSTAINKKLKDTLLNACRGQYLEASLLETC